MKNMCPEELVMLATTISIKVSRDICDDDELSVLANVLAMIAQNLSVLADRNCDNKEKPNVYDVPSN